jgi:hypothetical protein
MQLTTDHEQMTIEEENRLVKDEEGVGGEA